VFQRQGVLRGDILVERSPADHVEELHSVADGQNGKAAPESAGEEARFESVPIGRRRCDRESAPFSIERGREVLSARADQSVQAVEDGRDPFDFLEGTKENREPPRLLDAEGVRTVRGRFPAGPASFQIGGDSDPRAPRGTSPRTGRRAGAS
jgi:hypothetical protein